MEINREDVMIEEVSDDGHGYGIHTDKGTFFLSKDYGISPQRGDNMAVFMSSTNYVVGMEINGREIYHKNEQEFLKEIQELGVQETDKGTAPESGGNPSSQKKKPAPAKKKPAPAKKKPEPAKKKKNQTKKK